MLVIGIVGYFGKGVVELVDEGVIDVVFVSLFGVKFLE